MNDTFMSVLNEYAEISMICKDTLFNKMKENRLNYNNIDDFIFKQGNKYRKVLEVKKNSTEEISLKYLKKRLDTTFQLSYPNRQKIMRECFSITETINSMSEFVIFKFDFKDFFYSVNSIDVFNKYIKNSGLYRFERDILESLISNFKYCTPGLPTSNALVELISRDYDIKLKSLLHDHGLIFYSRYIDDSLLIFNKFVDERKILECIHLAIKAVFNISNIKLNNSKKAYLTSNSTSGTKFTYLGYLFEYTIVSNNKSFKYGIDQEKLNKYRKRLFKIIDDHNKHPNTELFRQRILFLSSRVVFYNTSRDRYSTKTVWDVIGLIASYGELRDFISPKKIERNTENFLRREIMKQVRNEVNIFPYFLKTNTDGYILEKRLLKNKSIIFHPKIGWSKAYLIKMIKKINPSFDERKKSYRNLVTTYCHLLKI
ncbi:reverse transcriptase domain-containing protein [Rossellomorea arthrocnemi]